MLKYIKYINLLLAAILSCVVYFLPGIPLLLEMDSYRWILIPVFFIALLVPYIYKLLNRVIILNTRWVIFLLIAISIIIPAIGGNYISNHIVNDKEIDKKYFRGNVYSVEADTFYNNIERAYNAEPLGLINRVAIENVELFLRDDNVRAIETIRNKNAQPERVWSDYYTQLKTMFVICGIIYIVFFSFFYTLFRYYKKVRILNFFTAANK
jgi:hypothetical protein